MMCLHEHALSAMGLYVYAYAYVRTYAAGLGIDNYSIISAEIDLNIWVAKLARNIANELYHR